jgi:hypothetical protein
MLVLTRLLKGNMLQMILHLLPAQQKLFFNVESRKEISALLLTHY